MLEIWLATRLAKEIYLIIALLISQEYQGQRLSLQVLHASTHFKRETKTMPTPFTN